jgi:tetratricopeptide (TPR) repeat protein
MKKIIFIIAILLSVSKIFAIPDTLSNTMKKANIAYKNGDYQKAQNLYESILKAGYEAPEVYYNLGNTYFKEKNIAKAILNYERARKLAPKDEDIKNNLEYANLFVKDEFNQVPEFFVDRFYNSILKMFSSNTWAVICIISFVLSLVFMLIFFFSKIIIRRKISFFSAIILFFISILSLNFSAQMKNYYTKPNSAIIMKINTMKSSPEEGGTDLFILNPGVKVKIKGQSDGWYEVKLPNGKIGWLKKSDVELI